MRFVHPEFLWGLLLLIIPVIIHLFSFRKYKTIYFSSLQFVQHVEQQNKSTQKLRNLLILLCRLLALAFIIIAFAQPYFPTGEKAASASNNVLCIHLDNSFSMTMKGVDGELLSEAKEAAREIINKAPLSTKILLSSNSLDGVESRLTTKVDALERLDQIKASSMNRSYDEVIAWQKNNLANAIQSDRFTKSQFIYLSDFQKSTNGFEKLDRDSVSQFIPIQLVSQQRTNLSVDSVWFTSPFQKVGSNTELIIKVSNHGGTDLQNVQVKFQSESIQRDIFVDIPKQSSTETSITFTPKERGLKKGKVVIADKHFFSDDEYYFTYTVADHTSVLIINGENSNASLATIYRLDPFYEVTELNQNAFTQGQLENKSLVILNGLNDISTSLTSTLTNYSKNGGTVAFFPGKSLNLNSINALLSQLKLPSITKLTQQNARINKINYKDPFFKGVFEKEKEDLSLPGVTSFYLVNESTASSANSVITLQNGKSLLYRRNVQPKSYLFTSILSGEFGSFTSDILFPTTILRMGELSLLSPPNSVTMGYNSVFPIYQSIPSNQTVYIKNKQLDFIPNTRNAGTVTYLDLTGTTLLNTLTAGHYTIETNGKIVSQMALNYNRQESAIDVWSGKEISEALERAGIKHTNIKSIDKGVSTFDLNIDKPYPYWKIFVSFALLFFLLEMVVIKFLKNKTGN